MTDLWLHLKRKTAIPCFWLAVQSNIGPPLYGNGRSTELGFTPLRGMQSYVGSNSLQLCFWVYTGLCFHQAETGWFGYNCTWLLAGKQKPVTSAGQSLRCPLQMTRYLTTLYHWANGSNPGETVDSTISTIDKLISLTNVSWFFLF
jgi:hypothetical protein